ncbi:hypothetical protein ACELLULO517_01325 [Acidisoma cellulosilytica]|uniref:AMP-dependent synthetase/ligase domain-containing protein n=1 Tax=Acidisoma cellulosilyticum TaxID=2802395 RepID=A0A963YX75_9PROT|nr:hypothetical protein [Acidisoma cellulosilyticum]MCB8878857.1 hypothetical protein [Acidisoma cellulosilyticum]
MASADLQIGGKTGAYRALLSVVAAAPNGLALRHKYRGDWLTWQWRAIARSVDALINAFVESGISAGDRIVLVGEITPRLLFTGLAADALGAETLLLPPTAKAADIVAATIDHPPHLAVIQGRESLDVWQQIRAQLGSVKLVFDHAAPGKRQDSSIIFFDDLLAGATSRLDGSNPLPSAATTNSDQGILWVEASTIWPGAITAVFDHWLGSGRTLVLPEILAAAARDRLEVRPASWLASDASLAIAARDIASRLPRRLIGTNKVEPRSFISGLIRHQARRRLGLGNLSSIDVEIAASHGEVFTSLGITLRPWSRTGFERPDISHHAGPRPSFAIAEILS